MRGVSKKMLISILTSVIVMVTMVATTFAWVGIFTYANTDNFQLNLKVSEMDVNYYLTISATGEKNSFSDTVDLVEIQRQALKYQNRWSSDYLDNLESSAISNMFSANSHIEPATCNINDDNTITDFKVINYKNTSNLEYISSPNSCIKFDVYLSVDTKEGIQDTTEINSNIYLTQLANTLEGSIATQKFTNGNPFLNMPSLPMEFSILKNITEFGLFKLNSANATRFALCMYEPKNINDQYSESDTPIKTLIYQGGTQLPSIDGDVYSLGGNLPEDYNTALQELLIIRPRYNDPINPNDKLYYQQCLQEAIERGEKDLELIEGNDKLWSKATNIDSQKYLGVHNGVQTKMKITVYLWFEGWDSDCLLGIENMPVTLNLTFTAGVEE